MPGFAWNDAKKFKTMAHCINFQACREKDRGPGWGTIIVDEKGYVDHIMVGKHEQFMADVLNAFPHGPPCIGSLKVATRFYVELFPQRCAAPEWWIEHEANKIHVLWKFVWNCFRRSPRSNYHSLDRLKTLLTLQRAGRKELDPACEDSHDGPEDWPDDEDARLATPLPGKPRTLRAELSVVSVASSGEDNGNIGREAGASTSDASNDQLPGGFQADCLRQDTLEATHSPKGAQLDETLAKRKNSVGL